MDYFSGKSLKIIADLHCLNLPKWEIQSPLKYMWQTPYPKNSQMFGQRRIVIVIYLEPKMTPVLIRSSSLVLGVFDLQL